MRPLKFRCWDKVNNRFLDDFFVKKNGFFHICDYESCFTPVSQENFIITQFIGLQDKNGKEIYEGDILLDPYQDDDEPYYLMEYAHQCFCMRHGNIIGYYMPDIMPNMEIMGNKFENPELLEKC